MSNFLSSSKELEVEINLTKVDALGDLIEGYVTVKALRRRAEAREGEGR